MPKTHEKLKDFLEKTNDVRLEDDGKSMKCLLCDKNIQNWVIVRDQTVAIKSISGVCIGALYVQKSKAQIHGKLMSVMVLWKSDHG